MAKSRTILTIILSIYCAFVSSENVPVFIWSNDAAQQLPTSLGGHSLGKNEFTNEHISSLLGNEKHNMVVFLQDRLSMDDITKYADVYSSDSDGDVFTNLKAVMERHTSTHLPAVASAGEALRSLEDRYKGDVQHVSASPDTTLNLSGDKRHILLVDLPATAASDEDYGKSLKKIDEIIGSLTRQLESSGKPFTAFYTGQRSSVESNSHVYTGRHLLAEAAGLNYTFINTSCVFFYAESISISSPSDKLTIDLPNIVQEDPSTECANDTLDLVLTFNDTSIIMNVTMRLLFTNRGYSWKLSNFTMDYNLVNGTTNVSGSNVVMSTSFIAETPRDFSYHCYQGDMVYDSINQTIGIKFTDLQVQAFGRKDDKFGYYNDCVGFFSIPIWSGIIVVLVLISILSFGLIMLANISTMDRFDDPKGKQMVVNVME